MVNWRIDTHWLAASTFGNPVKKPSFGWGSNFVLNDNLQFSYNGFWGYQNATGLMKRSYHNLYSNFTCRSWKGVLGFDFGTAFLNGERVEWYSPVLIMSKFINKQWNAALRIESMKDSKSFILFNDNRLMSQKSSIGFNVDYKTEKHWMIRFEVKQSFEKMVLDQKTQNTLFVFSLSKTTSL